MCLAVVGEDVFHLFVHFHAILAASLGYNVDAAKRLDGTLQQLIGLQAHNQFVLFINITRLVRSDGRYCSIVQCTHAIVLALFFQCLQADVPKMLGTLGRSLQEGCVPGVGCDVFTHKITYVDFFAPKPVNEGFVQFHNKFI